MDLQQLQDAEANERLDRLAAIPRSAEGKNHVHACRPGHPLGRDNRFKWRTAFATVESRRSFGNQPEAADLKWLRERADEEREAHSVVVNESDWAAHCAMRDAVGHPADPRNSGGK